MHLNQHCPQTRTNTRGSAAIFRFDQRDKTFVGSSQFQHRRSAVYALSDLCFSAAGILECGLHETLRLHKTINRIFGNAYRYCAVFVIGRRGARHVPSQGIFIRRYKAQFFQFAERGCSRTDLASQRFKVG